MTYEKSSWHAIMAEYFNALGDATKLKVFRTATCTQPWKESAKSIDGTVLAENIARGHAPGIVPDAVKFLVMGADTQEEFFYYEIWGWGPMAEGWLIRYGVAGSLEDLWRIGFEETYPREDGKAMRCGLALVDSGGHHATDVMDFCKYRPCMEALKGEQNKRYDFRLSEPIEYTVEGRGRPDSTRVVLVSSRKYRDRVQAGLEAPDGPNAMHLHRDVDATFVRHMTNMAFVCDVNKRTGEKTWYWRARSKNASHDYADCAAYARAAHDFFLAGKVLRAGDPVVYGYCLGASNATAGHTRERKQSRFREMHFRQ